MAEGTSISWTDNTFNPWIGCTKVSPGCDNCYAESLDHRWGNDRWGKGKTRTATSDANWLQPLKWNRDAEKSCVVAKVFCGSMCDVMDDEAPEGTRERLWALIDATPHLLWQLLSKRPSRYERYLPAFGFAHDNVMLGATTENQGYFDLRMDATNRAAQMLRRRNKVTRGLDYLPPVKFFASYEPALGPIDAEIAIVRFGYMPDWIIFGGETGPHRRPMEQKWAEDLKAQCDACGVSFFMKQMSAATPAKAAALIPVHLLVHQFPEVQ